jgi:hypothetical protein
MQLRKIQSSYFVRLFLYLCKRLKMWNKVLRTRGIAAEYAMILILVANCLLVSQYSVTDGWLDDGWLMAG